MEWVEYKNTVSDCGGARGSTADLCSHWPLTSDLPGAGAQPCGGVVKQYGASLSLASLLLSFQSCAIFKVPPLNPNKSKAMAIGVKEKEMGTIEKVDIQGIEPWTSRMRSVRATTVPNALM